MTTDLFGPRVYSLEDQIACLQREIAMRQRVYARLVGEKKMTQQKSDDEIGAMTAALRTLTSLKENPNA